MSFILRRTILPLSRRTFSTTTTRPSFAKMTIVGRLADRPELQATSTSTELLRYVVATNSGPKDNQKSSFFRVTSFAPEGAQRDFIAGLEKGTLVYVEGNASMDTYADAEGKNRTALNLVQTRIDVLSPKKQQ
ncbi:hypothetical protein BJ878DRAFT_516020 [Calycina marina]|uniref:Single-stranded DNA-binding protein n=1 Tax=Calycina marina TaxID=1763456 RepID=A0A9P8CEI3_9HELO|nr:hypothetical protein BJ878DRAFT_516020 [Calycina marina]